MVDTAVATLLATRFKARLAAGDVLGGDNPGDRLEDDHSGLYEYFPGSSMSLDELRETCVHVLEALGGKSTVDELSGYYINGVWARVFVGTEEDPDDDIRFILELTRKQP